MSKAYIQNPLVMMGLAQGYRRPLERGDFRSKAAWTRAATRMVPRMVFQRVLGDQRGMANLNLVAGPAASVVDTYSWGTTQKHPLGTVAITKDGRVYRYASAGAADLVAGNIIQSAAPIANHLALTAAAEAIGAGLAADPITVTPGATGGAAGLYGEGTLNIDTTPGNGYNYRISGHAAITASVAFSLYLDPDELIAVALTTSSRYGLHHNPFKTCIVAATTVTAAVVGCAAAPITANTVSENYGWLQSRGPASVLINGTPGVGIGVVSGATTAGSVDVAAVAAEINVRIIGRMMQVGVSGKNNSVYLMLD